MAQETDTPAWKASLLEGITAFPHVYTIVTCADTTHDLSPVFEADKDAYYARQVQEYCEHIQSSLHAKASIFHEEVQTLRDENRDLKKEVATLNKVIDRVGAPKHTDGQLLRRQTRDHPTFNATEKDIEKRQEEYVGSRSKAMRNLAVDKTIYNTEFRRLQYIGSMLDGGAYTLVRQSLDAITMNPDDTELWEWKTADDLIEFLNGQYETIDLDRTASRNFDNYFMTNKPFENFIAEFNKLATLAGKNAPLVVHWHLTNTQNAWLSRPFLHRASWPPSGYYRRIESCWELWSGGIDKTQASFMVQVASVVIR
ncbi:ATP-dependent DNA helicase PIF1 [Purpureocillium lavendulum]|uniref:ATP-dependent DNA helicase PIF1 n=1 Tax=Purpureocillium lavendulum TaxID=1247861 RepID=A0AB34FC35_9HYPO|nr:ATP-dependent DNA helicase PIF1 [Purpureocillium lavendulum]